MQNNDHNEFNKNILNNDIGIDMDIEISDITTKIINVIIPNEYARMRLDVALTKLLPQFSRTNIHDLIKNSKVLLNNQLTKVSYQVMGREHVSITTETTNNVNHVAQNIPINVKFIDEHIIIIDKPAGLIVHPGNGNPDNTLLNALLFHYPDLAAIPRAGIIHRLDKDTSGLMMIARTAIAYNKLVADLQQRIIKRTYRAIVDGNPYKEGIVRKNIGRDDKNRLKMAVRAFGGKEAVTRYKVLQYFHKFSYIECELETGRTHQIRVHMKSINHPITADPLYNKFKIHNNYEINQAIINLNRQALHAISLQLYHPVTNELLKFNSNLPQDIKLLFTALHNELNEQNNKNIVSSEYDFNPLLQCDEDEGGYDNGDDIDDDEHECEIIYINS